MNALSPIQSGLLSELDWRVVDMARDDGPRSLNPDGFFARVSRDFIGLPVPRRLTNPELEALRRFAVRAWYWDVIRTADLRALLDEGYSKEHVLEILARVAAVRGFTPSVQDEEIEHSSIARLTARSKPPRRAGVFRHCG
jgi:hypothetical protein